MIGLAELRAVVRITGTAQDARLAALEAAAVDHLERETGRYFGPPDTVTEVLVGDGTPTLWLEELLSGTAPTTIIERASPGATETTYTDTDDDGFVIRGTTLTKLVRRNGLVWRPGFEYELTYQRGYESGSEPQSARLIVEQLVALWFERRIEVPKPGEVFSFPIPNHTSRLIQGLRRLRV